MRAEPNAEALGYCQLSLREKGRSLGREAVADSGLGRDQGRGGGVLFQFFPEVGYVDTQVVCAFGVVRAPNFGQ